ncbi:MAG: ATPase [Tannerella sp.]|jgi:N-acetylglucosamine kinase-like BadF-type ATPase|nr:ATPase [Tannerella sp.]
MILIADSGSTKADWRVVDEEKILQSVQTKGFNPFFQSEEEMGREISTHLLDSINPLKIEAVYFYGAGCVFEKVEIMRRVIMRHFHVEHVEVNTDLLAAARSSCGMEAGIACIMGTGSNSCFYDGEQIVQTVSPLGYILGDEGSGADLGKQLVKDLLKDMIAPELKETFLRQFGLTLSDIMEHVYRRPLPNRFLASFAPFLSEHVEDQRIHTLVLNRFKSFLRRNVMKYDYRNFRAHFVGSVAYYFRTILEEAAADTGVRIGSIIHTPMEGLIIYHTTDHTPPPVFFDI